ncbi:hypothetical protein BT96DRAFT_839466, partial [Gymnopus androsaceus JB14]
ALKSWWPRPQAWKLSGLNTGYWSSDAEQWYQRHLEKIRSGEATIMTNNEWRPAIKFNKEAA